MATARIYNMCRDFRLSIEAPWFDGAWDGNLIISRDGRVGTWGDRAFWCCVDDAGREVVQAIRCSSDAWPGEWENPTHPEGCPYILDQHVPQGLILGKHKDRDALRQNNNFRYARWPGGTTPTVRALEALPELIGNFGTHFHNNYDHRTLDAPQRGSTVGCVLSMYQHQHSAKIQLVRQQQAATGSAVVSPTFTQKHILRSFYRAG